jgi:regulator of protease activity HflC (stomatin/prohibitin superfamily)
MNELLLRDLIRSGSAFALLAVHALVLLYGQAGGRRGLRTAVAYLVAFDWALILGVTAGRSVADGSALFWSWHTVRWGLLGVILLFTPAWLLLQLGLRFSGALLLPATPTDRRQREQAGRALRAYAWGVNRPFYREEDGELRKVAEGSLMLRGIVAPKLGPGFVMASNHYATPLTVGTRDTQIGGGGLVFTGRLERPRSPIDLRPQARIKEIQALTRDGIPVKVMMVAVFQVDRRGATGDELYPFDPGAVFAAMQAQGVGPKQEEEPGEPRWDQIVVDRAADLLRAAIARTLLDRLLESDEGDDEEGKPPREELRAEVKKDLAQAMEPHSIDVIAVGLGNIEVEDAEVLSQRAESWRAGWERRRLEIKAQGEAEAIRLTEEARADAQRQMIVAITEAFQQLADTGTPVPAHVIALRFIDVLEDVAASPSVQKLLPERVQGIPAKLRLLMEQATAGDEDRATQ